MSGTTATLSNDGYSFDGENDGIVIIKNLETVPGGKTLDVTGFDPTVIPEGHVLIKKDADGSILPMPVSGDAYDALPANHTYYGVVISSTLTSKPLVGVLRRGSVNIEASAYEATSILTALKAALPLIIFTED